MADNPWLSFLEGKPEAGYGAWLSPWQATPRMWGTMGNQYQDWYNRYLGELGGQIMRGEDPTLKWMDYLGKYDPAEEYRRTSYWQRGVQSAPMFKFIGR